MSYFVKNKKTTPTFTETLILRKEHQMIAPTSNSTSVNAFLSKPLPSPTIACISNNPNPSTCLGIIPTFRENEFQLNAESFMLNGVV